MVFLCIPYGTVEPIKEKLYSAFSADRDELDIKWLERLKERLREIPLTLTGNLGGSRVTVQDVIDLKVGDVITLDKRVDEDIDILAEETPKFKGRFGIYKGSYALKITKTL